MAAIIAFNPSFSDQRLNLATYRLSRDAAIIGNGLQVDCSRRDGLDRSIPEICKAHFVRHISRRECAFTDNRQDKEQVQVPVARAATGNEVASQCCGVHSVELAKIPVVAFILHGISLLSAMVAPKMGGIKRMIGDIRR